MADGDGRFALLESLHSYASEKESANLDWVQMRNTMTQLKLWAKERENRIKISKSNLEELKKILQKSVQVIKMHHEPSHNNLLVDVLGAIVEALRFLRNAVAEVSTNQLVLVIDVGLIEEVKAMISILLKPLYQEMDLGLKFVNDAIISGLQLLGNSIVQNTEVQEFVWRKCFPSFFLNVLSSASYKAQDCLCMTIFNCIVSHNKSELVSTHEGYKIISHILHLCADHEELQWGFLILDHLLMAGYISDIYSGLEFDPSARMILLDLIQARLTGERTDNPPQHEPCSSPNTSCVPSESLVFLAKEFEAHSRLSDFTNPDGDGNQMFDALVISRLLTVMCAATSLHLSVLQDRSSLLQRAVELLQETSREENREAFTSVSRIPQGTDSGELSPSHGFKRDLVRLLGNMCYNHRQNQDKVRELEGIPLILDHCNVDDYNPYICQWAIFAVRNLLEDNIANQQTVATLDKRGLADTSRLQQFGVTVRETQEGRIKLLPVKKNSEK